MRTLYIIGNGFDLSHGLKTSYIDFSEWVKKNYRDIFEKIDLMIKENNELKYIGEHDIGWFDFENSLHKLIQSPVFENYVQECSDAYLMGYGDENWSDSAHHDFQYQVQDYIVSLQELQDHFKEWIREEVYPTIESISSKYEFSNDSLFFTFNYTDVLEIVYNQPKINIYHIHGNYDNIIIGHSERFQNFIGDPFDQDEDVRITEAASIITGVHNSLNKNVQLQIDKLKENTFFDRLEEVCEVRVIGHSYNHYDWPYFYLLKNKTGTNTRWMFNYWSVKDLENLNKMVSRLKINNYEAYKI